MDDDKEQAGLCSSCADCEWGIVNTGGCAALLQPALDQSVNWGVGSKLASIETKLFVLVQKRPNHIRT